MARRTSSITDIEAVQKAMVQRLRHSLAAPFRSAFPVGILLTPNRIT